MLGLNIDYIFVCLFIYFDIYLSIYVFLNDDLSLVLRDWERHEWNSLDFSITFWVLYSVIEKAKPRLTNFINIFKKYLFQRPRPENDGQKTITLSCLWDWLPVVWLVACYRTGCMRVGLWDSHKSIGKISWDRRWGRGWAWGWEGGWGRKREGGGRGDGGGWWRGRKLMQTVW